MKICYIASLFDPELGGGAAKVVFDLAHEIAKLGNEVAVITTSSKKDHKTYINNNFKIYQIYAPNLYWIYDKDNQPVIKKFLFHLIDTWNPFVKSKIKKILEIETPNIVHFHKIRGLSPAVWPAAKEAGIKKIIHTCHDYELISPQGLLEGRIGELSLKRAFPINFYQKKRANSSNSVTDVITPSKLLIEQHTKFDFFKFADKYIIPNTHGLSKEVINKNRKSSSSSFESKELKILYLGRVVKEKGVGLICDLISKFEKEDLKIKLIIVGSGQYETQLKKQYKDSLNITFHGSNYGPEKYRFLKDCDLLVVPSLVPESFGIVVTEAFAFGKPVIASNIGAIPELIQDGYIGFLFEPNNIEQLENIIKNIYDNKSILDEMRDNCFRSAEKYCIENFIEKHLEIYNAKI